MRERERKMSAHKTYEVPYESVFYKKIKDREEEDN